MIAISRRLPSVGAGGKGDAHDIPIVFVRSPTQSKLGLVASLARPGGNITGFTHFEMAT